MSTQETGAMDLSRHHQPQGLSDRLAVGGTGIPQRLPLVTDDGSTKGVPPRTR